MRVIHVLRAPVGGLFRHVRDLAGMQAASGLEVGVICDRRASDGLTMARLEALKPDLALGLHLVPMSRDLGPSDFSAWSSVRRIARERGADILHGHGAKGGAHARLAAAAVRRTGGRIGCLYTPHGGSLHYHPASLKGRVFMALERRLATMTDAIVFESAYSETVYRAQVGTPACPVRVVANGLRPEEFGEHQPADDAADVLYIGELRRLKGVDVLLEALALLGRDRPVSVLIVGDGPDRPAFEDQVVRLGLTEWVRFAGAMPAAEAFPRGRVLAMPSRAESLPYVVLEAAAAGIPLVATDVGGIPEIVAGSDVALVPAGDAAALAAGLRAALAEPEAARARAGRLRQVVANSFTVARMAAEIGVIYEALTSR